MLSMSDAVSSYCHVRGGPEYEYAASPPPLLQVQRSMLHHVQRLIKDVHEAEAFTDAMLERSGDTMVYHTVWYRWGEGGAG